MRHAVPALVDGHEPGERLEDGIDGRPLTVRPGLAEARHGEIDDARVQDRDRVVAHAELRGHAGAEALEEHVATCHQPAHDLQALIRLQIDRDAALAQVGGHRECRLIAVARTDRARPVALGRLHLNHVGAVEREQHGRVGPGDALAEVHHAHAGEGRFVAHLLGASCSWGASRAA